MKSVTPEEDAAHDYTEVYVWGSIICYSYFSPSIDDSFGQLGISSEGGGKNYCKPKFCSFNIIIKELSCGEEHTALITSIIKIIYVSR